MNNTLRTMITAPIRNDTGYIVVRQCHPKLRYVPRPPLATLTPNDIEMRIRHNLSLIRVVKNK